MGYGEDGKMGRGSKHVSLAAVRHCQGVGQAMLTSPSGQLVRPPKVGTVIHPRRGAWPAFTDIQDGMEQQRLLEGRREARKQVASPRAAGVGPPGPGLFGSVHVRHI